MEGIRITSPFHLYYSKSKTMKIFGQALCGITSLGVTITDRWYNKDNLQSRAKIKPTHITNTYSSQNITAQKKALVFTCYFGKLRSSMNFKALSINMS